MGQQVMEGLFEHESIRRAMIGHPGEEPLASKSRPPMKLATRELTDAIFGATSSIRCR